MNKRLKFILHQAHILTFVLPMCEAGHIVATQQSIDIPTIESNLVAVAVSFRKTLLTVNGIDVPVFLTETNELGAADTGVLFCIVSPKQLSNMLFVLGRDSDKTASDVLTPSYYKYAIGNSYKIPYSIRDVGSGQGINLHLNGGGMLSVPVSITNTACIQRSSVMSNVKTAGNCFRTYTERFYVSAAEASNELCRLRTNFGQYEIRFNAIKEGIKNELARRERLGIATQGVYLLDETDVLARYQKEQVKVVPLYFDTKREIDNAEKQLKAYEMRRNKDVSGHRDQ